MTPRARALFYLGLQWLTVVALLNFLLFLNWNATIEAGKLVEAERVRLLSQDGFKGGFAQ